MTTGEATPGFAAHARDRNLSAARILCVLIAVLVPSGFVLDVVVAPGYVGQFLIYRLACSVVSLACFWLTFRPWAPKHVYLLGLIPSLATAIALELMIIELGAHSSSYYAGLTQLILAVAVALYWRLREILVAAGLILAIWLAPALNEWHELEFAVFFNNLYSLLVFLSIAVAGTWTRRRLLAREYVAQSELSRALAKLKELDKAKNRFFANVSHELRTPITLILAPLDEVLATDEDRQNPSSAGQLAMARRSALKLLRLVDDILELTRLESTSVRFRKEPLHLGKLVDEVVARTVALAGRKGLVLKTKAAEGDVEIMGDAAHIEKVVLNLLANSMKFTNEGEVEIQVNERGDGVELAVRDTGIGIGEEDLPHVFERFHQADAGSTRKNTGTGIGLALAKEIVTLHGGTLTAESVLGEGTTMRVWLPKDVALPGHALERRSRKILVEEDRREARGLPEWHAELREGDDYKLLHVQAATERRIAPRPVRAPSKVNRVLVVEDNPDMVQLIVGLLSVDYDVQAAGDGEQGLAMARSKLPDLIVSDVMMPKLNGFDMIRALRADPATKHIPTILLTARGQVEDRIEGREGGADAHLTKPFRPEELRITVRDLLTKQGQQVVASRDERDSAMRLLSEGVAHEVLNPLGFVQNAFFALQETVEDLRQAAPGSPELEELEQRIQALYRAGREGIARTRVAVDDLRRMGDGSSQLPTTLDVNDAVTKISNLASVRKNVRISHELGASRPVSVPPGQVEKILLNLVQNAEHASEGDALITIKTWDVQGGVCVAVADQGSGIPRDLLEKIFHPYFTTKPPDQGSGLGLALCRQIARDIGGRLDVDSQPGIGSTFTLWLPGVTAQRAEPRNVA